MDYTFQFLPSGRVKSVGVDFGGRLTLHERLPRVGEPKVLVIHRAAHKAWVSNFDPWKYCPAQYFVFRVVRKDPITNEFTCESIIDFPVSFHKAKEIK